MKKIPDRGAYAILINHELAAVIGYDLDKKEAHLIKLKDVEMKDAQGFVDAVRRGDSPGVPPEQTIAIKRWELYGIPHGPIEEVTQECWKKLEEDLALKPGPGGLP